ncbi:MAG TPA: MBL fold metallo-hydrolase [Terriglobia bacterium]|nr:MBL fold metallo-hydrolase [Terriglobia bacterium]
MAGALKCMWIFRKNVRGPESGVRRLWHIAHDRAASRLLSTVYSLLIAFSFLHSAILFSAIPGRYELKEIRPHVFVWIPEDLIYLVGDPKFDRAGTAAFIITREGVLVVDTTNNPFNARELLYEIRERTDLPVKYVIDTDARGDHMLGNEVFVDQGATIISTSVARIQMSQYQQDLARRMMVDERLQARMRGIHITLPNQTFDGALSLQLGGEEFRLLDLGNGASAGDAAVYMPREKVLFLGDLYENGVIPRRGMSDVPAWLKILGQVESMDVLSYVPGGGPPGDKNDFEEFRQFLEWVAGMLDPSHLLESPPSPGRLARMTVAQ